MADSRQPKEILITGSETPLSRPLWMWLLVIVVGGYFLYYFKSNTGQPKKYIRQKKDITNIDDIKKLVDTFYEKIRKDNLIGPIFNNNVRENWPEHLDKMYRFWQTVLLGELTYFGSPFPAHTKMNIDDKHFQRWLGLFIPTVNDLFEGTKATEIKWRAKKIVELFESKLALYKNQGLED